MKNVLVIGAGRRVRGAVLPALWCLPDRFRVAAVLSRTARELPAGPGRPPLTTVTSLDSVDVPGLDLIVAAPTIGEVPRLLAQLVERGASRAALLLDTPVLPPTGLWAASYFSSFARVLASEDSIALPPFLLARRLIDAGAVGQLQRLFFFHNGYKHHALASLKLLTGRSPIRRIVGRKFGGKRRQKQLAFANGMSATMYEPRDYATGRFLLQGDRGAIADYDYAVPPVERIGYVVEQGIYRGLTLNGEPVPPAGLDHDYLANIGTDLFDATPMTTMKIRGLMDLLVAAGEESSPLHYDPAEAVADFLTAQILDKVSYLPSPHLLEHLLRAGERLPVAAYLRARRRGP